MRTPQSVTLPALTHVSQPIVGVCPTGEPVNDTHRIGANIGIEEWGVRQSRTCECHRNASHALGSVRSLISQPRRMVSVLRSLAVAGLLFTACSTGDARDDTSLSHNPAAASSGSSTSTTSSSLKPSLTTPEPALTLAVPRLEMTAAESAQIVIPIVEHNDPVVVRTSTAKPDWSIVVPWGDGPGQVGLLTPNDGEIAQPTSIAVDPRTENPVVLDRVNRRLVIIGHYGNRDVPLPGTGFIYDVVIHGDTGVATVPRFDVVGQERTTTAIEVDLDAGTTDTFGPVVVPSATPINTQFVWQPFNRSVYAVVDNVYYPYFDSNTQTLVAGESPVAWVDAVVNPDGSIGIGPRGSHMVHRFSRPAVGVVSSVVDGTSIWFEASIEGPPDADGNATFSPELVRTDAMHGTASAIQLRPSGFDSFTRRFAVHGDHAYVMSRAVDGLLIERYTIRQP
jgi:hypothetical protein